MQVLRRRLYKTIRDDQAKEVVAHYAQLWGRYRDQLTPEAASPETRDQFRAWYPFHPETMNVLVEERT